MGSLEAVLLGSTRPGYSYLPVRASPTGFKIERSDGGNMAGEVITWKASQGTN
jgi:hypothetical protein